MAVITYIGAGQMASALTFPAFENGHEIRLVGTPLDREIIEECIHSDFHINLKRKLHHGIRYYQVEEVQDSINGADVILCGVSSFGVEWFREEILHRIPRGIPVLSVTKGMIEGENGTLVTYPDYWESSEGGKGLMIQAIGGPCTSYEMADHDPTNVAFCGKDVGILRYLKSLYATDYYHVTLSDDVKGVELAVALKNAYALAVSLTIGCVESREGKGVLHYNSQAAAFTQAICEIQNLLRFFGGRDENIMYAAGDLYVTIFGGRTRRIGILLGNGMPLEQALEELKGVTLESLVISGRVARTIRSLDVRGELNAADFPLLMHVDEVISRGAEPELPWKLFEKEFFTE